MAHPYPTKAQFESWLATRSEAVQRIGKRLPATTCYRIVDLPGHFLIHGYKDESVTLGHGGDSEWPGLIVSNVEPSRLIECGCGKWPPPTDEQVRDTRRRF